MCLGVLFFKWSECVVFEFTDSVTSSPESLVARHDTHTRFWFFVCSGWRFHSPPALVEEVPQLHPLQEAALNLNPFLFSPIG